MEATKYDSQVMVQKITAFLCKNYSVIQNTCNIRQLQFVYVEELRHMFSTPPTMSSYYIQFAPVRKFQAYNTNSECVLEQELLIPEVLQQASYGFMF